MIHSWPNVSLSGMWRSPEHVVVESIVASQGYKPAPPGPHGVKYLNGCVTPNLWDRKIVIMSPWVVKYTSNYVILTKKRACLIHSKFSEHFFSWNDVISRIRKESNIWFCIDIKTGIKMNIHTEAVLSTEYGIID